MKPRSLRAVAAAVGGSLRGADAIATGVTVDGRRLRRGDLYFALRGSTVDGHRFVDQALDNGACGAVVIRGAEVPAREPLIEVDDSGAALLDLAADEREGLTAVVVGITGSTGKTCTKDFTRSVLRERYRVVASPASFNNEIGLPLTLLEADRETEAVVCEMGSRGPGHIRLLCGVARPKVGVVTNVGVAHMELFGSSEALRDAKAELPEALPTDGVAVLNADDPVTRSYASRTPAGRIVLFGDGPDATIRARSVRVHRETGRAEFDLVTPDGSARVILPVPGEHMVANALAAAGVGWALDVPVDAAARGLSAASVAGGRMEVVEAGGLRILNDAYNANPASMAAALKAARWMAGEGRCIAVLGPMAELGEIAPLEHERVGELVARLGIEVLVVVGPEAHRIAVGAGREGVEPDRIISCDDVACAVEAVRDRARPGDLVLVKASRVARLERVAEALARHLDGAGTDVRGASAR